ncbi:transglycosylase domain-containing protein [Microlunatus kandeliicorticis]|nr:transglycosylase domain-containing protein [Microlunatus kandeliicorticis]
MFVVVSMLAGLLVAGLVVPFAGLAGVGSRATAAEMEKIPAEFTTPPQPERSTVYMANGEKLATFYEQDRVYEPLSKIAPIMQKAQVAIEDHRFFEHGALDVKGTVRALVRNTAGGSTQGGSSITQQYVKMVRIEQAQLSGDDAGVKAATDETYARKIQELRYAIALEKQLTKEQILERYLNIAYYGDGAYGVEAAARHYFDTSAAKLTLPEAAMLAGLVQNPEGTNPAKYTEAAINRRDVVLNRMAELGVITTAQATSAKKVKFDKSKISTTPNGCLDSRYPFLCSYVRTALENDPALGKTKQDRENAILRGGLTVQTKIDPDSQDKAQKALSAFINAKDPLISTMVEIEPGTGLIKAMAQNRPVMGNDAKKGETYFNYAATAQYGGAEGYQSGSTMKAVTMAAALEQGIPISKRYNARSPMDFSNYSFKTCSGQNANSGKYVASNDVGHSTNIDMRTAAEYSVNTYFLQLEQDVGVCNVTKMAQRLGIQRADGRPITDDSNSLAFTLGISEIAPISLATAYATFAARGIRCDPIIISKITSGDGKSIAAPSANCRRVIDQDVADGVNDLLQSVITRGTGLPALVPDGHPQAGKTGTIEDNAAVWFAGYTPNLTGVAMIAKDKQAKRFRNNPTRGVKGVYLENGGVLGGTGGGDAGRNIWKPAMTAALQDLPATDFVNPSKDIREGKQVPIPNLSGMSFSEAQSALDAIGVNLTRTYSYSSSVPAGSFMYYTPSSGTVAQFGSVYAVYSAGKSPSQVAAEQRAAAAKKKAAEEKQKQQEQQNSSPSPSSSPTGKPGG